MKRIQMFTVKASDDSAEFYTTMRRQELYRCLHEWKQQDQKTLASLIRQMAEGLPLTQERNPPC